jgi:FixJ family two-component response regulator
MAANCKSAFAMDWTDMPIFYHGPRQCAETVQAMKAGAVEFPTKPLSDDLLLSGIRQALERSARSSHYVFFAIFRVVVFFPSTQTAPVWRG